MKLKLVLMIKMLLFISVFSVNSQSFNVKYLLTLDWRFYPLVDISNVKLNDTLYFVSCSSCYELKDSLVLNPNIQLYRTMSGDSEGFKSFKFGNTFILSFHKSIHGIGIEDIIDIQGHWKYKKKNKTLILKKIRIYEPDLEYFFNKNQRIKLKILEINEQKMKLIVN
jgi:hypothetical protein